MNAHRLYDEMVNLWPLVAGEAYYAAEAAKILPVLRRELRLGRRRRLEPSPSGRGQGEGSWCFPKRSRKFQSPHPGPLPEGEGVRKPTLLELGVGGGHVIAQIAPLFDCVGVDLSPRMLEHSARLNPGVEHVVGDMRSVRLGRVFDAVLLHDSVHYMLSEADLLAAFQTAAVHLRPGGVVLALPGYVRETFKIGDVSYGFDGASGGELTHLAYTVDPNPADTTYTLVMLMFLRDPPPGGRRGAGPRLSKVGKLRVEEDRHTLGLFPLRTWLRVMRRVGLAVRAPKLRMMPGRGQPALSQDLVFVGGRK